VPQPTSSGALSKLGRAEVIRMTDARIDQAKGDVKAAAGKVTDDKDLEAQGRAESAEAGLRKDAADLMDKTKQAAGDVMDKTKDVAGDVADKAKGVADDVSDKAKEVFSR
jgi:uncharacterized protein YjbJ (UPF0337 family)